MMKPSLLSLFSGIGGIDLAFQLAGFNVMGQIEIDLYCQRVLGKNFPDTPRWSDIQKVGGDEILSTTDGVTPDVIAGGFPCQDISISNQNAAGLSGERSGLWWEFARVIGELQPKYVFVENVPAITSRGGLEVIGSLTSLGYDTEWAVIPAAAFGAPHKRDRFWLVGHTHRQRHIQPHIMQSDFDQKRNAETPSEKWKTIFYEAFSTSSVLPDTASPRLEGSQHPQHNTPESGQRLRELFESRMGGATDGIPRWVDGFRLDFPAPPNQPQHPWESPRTVPKGSITNRTARIIALGNAVVPQVILPIALAIYKQLEAL